MKVGLEQLIDPRLSAFVEEACEFNAAAAVAKNPIQEIDPRTSEGLEAHRSGLSVRPVADGPPAEEVTAEVDGRQVPVRITNPQDGPPRGVFLEIHGGGFYMSRAARSDYRNRLLADAVGIAVVSVDYRLAPEHPFPAAPDDCETAALWLLDQAQARFGTSRLAIGGGSAGGNLAMTTLLRLRAKDLLEPFVGAAIKYGAFDLSARTPVSQKFSDEYFLEAYLGEGVDRSSPDISPLLADLHDLPPMLLTIGALDDVLEDTLLMAMRLSAAGGEVDLRVYPESPHGFLGFPIAMAQAAWEDIEEWLGERFAAA
jgi:acetyl esterase